MFFPALAIWLASLAASDPGGWVPSRAPNDEDRRLGAIVADAAAHSPELTRWQDLPQDFRDALAAHGIRGMSDVGGPFNATDSGISTSRTRLRYAITARGYWFLCYETGGIVHAFHLAIWSGDPPLWLHIQPYRAMPAPSELGPDLAAHYYFDEPKNPP